MTLLLMLACSSRVFPTATLDVGGHSVSAELVANNEDRARGLMYRDAIGEDEGMLFMYPTPRKQSFWMKNTRIPLSIAFISASGEILQISDMNPFETSSTKSVRAAKYALEMNQGWFKDHDVKKRARVTGIPTDEQAEVK